MGGEGFSSNYRNKRLIIFPCTETAHFSWFIQVIKIYIFDPGSDSESSSDNEIPKPKKKNETTG